MPKGVRLGGRQKGTPNKKTVWIMESLAEHGYDYEAMLTKFLGKAAQGDRLALDMAHLLIKLVPYLANAPKNDAGTLSIDTLVINRYAVNSPDATQGDINRFEPSKQMEAIETTAEETLTDGHPPLTTP